MVFLRTHEEPSALARPVVCSNERRARLMPSFQAHCLHKEAARTKASEPQNRASSVGAGFSFLFFFLFFFFHPAGWQHARDDRQAACLVSTPHLDNRSGWDRGRKTTKRTRGGALGQFCECVCVCVCVGRSACVCRLTQWTSSKQ